MLTETLDSIPVDEDGLPSFEALADGDVTNASDRSCPSSPDGSPRTPEPEEPSLVRTAAASSSFGSRGLGIKTWAPRRPSDVWVHPPLAD